MISEANFISFSLNGRKSPFSWLGAQTLFLGPNKLLQILFHQNRQFSSLKYRFQNNTKVSQDRPYDSLLTSNQIN